MRYLRRLNNDGGHWEWRGQRSEERGWMTQGGGYRDYRVSGLKGFEPLRIASTQLIKFRSLLRCE